MVAVHYFSARNSARSDAMREKQKRQSNYLEVLETPPETQPSQGHRRRQHQCAAEPCRAQSATDPVTLEKQLCPTFFARYFGGHFAGNRYRRGKLRLRSVKRSLKSF